MHHDRTTVCFLCAVDREESLSYDPERIINGSKGETVIIKRKISLIPATKVAVVLFSATSLSLMAFGPPVSAGAGPSVSSAPASVSPCVGKAVLPGQFTQALVD